MSTLGLLHRLIDDAAIFPPGNAPLDQAVEGHRRHRTSAYADLVGPLLVRDVDIDEVCDLADEPLEVGVIATSGPAGLARAIARAQDSVSVTVSSVEIPVPPGDDLAAATKELVRGMDSTADAVTVSIELPRSGGAVTPAWIRAADEIGAAGFQAKLRTGGVVAGAYPDEDELAAMLSQLVLRHQPLKLTAGLHRAVRNTQPGTGFEQHGFVNVLVTVHRLLSGATTQEAAEVLRSRDGQVLADLVRSWSEDEAATVRRVFRGFGSCSVTEPFADLTDLGLAA